MTQVKKRGLWDILTRNEKRVFAKRIIGAGVLFAVGLGLVLWDGWFWHERQGLPFLLTVLSLVFTVLPMVFWGSGIAIGYLSIGWLVGVGEERKKWIQEAETGPAIENLASQETK